MKQITEKTFASLILTSLLFSCAGQSSNPLEKYKDLKMVDPSAPNLEMQTIAPPDLFQIEVVGTNEVNLIQFVEGQQSQTLLRVTPKSALITGYQISMKDFSSTERPTLIDTPEKNIFALQWNPPVGTIPGGQLSKVLSANLLLSVTASSNPQMLGLTKTEKIPVMVNRNSAQPQIIGHTDLKSGLDEGVDLHFTVDVEDEGRTGSLRLPELQITPYLFSNTEAYRANGSRYVDIDDSSDIKNNPEEIGENKFRFYMVMYADRLPFNRDRAGHEIPNAPTVDVCFQMRAVSAVSTVSDQIQICTVARYATQPPQVIFKDQELKSLHSGQTNTITFMARADHPSAVISIAAPLTQIASLTGQKNLACSTAQGKTNELNCVLTWTPACQKTDSTKSLTLKFDNTLGSNKKSTTETKDFTILADPNQCAKPKEGVK